MSVHRDVSGQCVKFHMSSPRRIAEKITRGLHWKLFAHMAWHVVPRAPWPRPSMILLCLLIGGATRMHAIESISKRTFRLSYCVSTSIFSYVCQAAIDRLSNYAVHNWRVPCINRLMCTKWVSRKQRSKFFIFNTAFLSQFWTFYWKKCTFVSDYDIDYGYVFRIL